MITIAHVENKTIAKPAAIFALWANVDRWAEYDQSIEWAKLADSFVEGGHCIIKPRNGPKTKATIMTMIPDEQFTIVSSLPGAKLTFDHVILDQFGTVIVKQIITLDGPFSRLWKVLLGKNQQAELERTTKALITRGEDN